MFFGFDFQTIASAIFAKTLEDMRWREGAGGGFPNLFGGGFGSQLPIGDSFQFAPASSVINGNSNPSLTTEEEVDLEIKKEKFEALKKVMNGYANTLGNTREDRIIKKDIEKITSYSEENFDKLQELYEKNKLAVDKYKDDEKTWCTKYVTIAPSQITKSYTTGILDNTNNRLKNVDSCMDGDSLKSDLDVLELLVEIRSYNNLYKNRAIPQHDAVLGKFTKALFNALKAKGNEIISEKNISNETRTELNTLLAKDAASANSLEVDNLYSLIRIAKAEIADVKMQTLKDAFPEDKTLKADKVEGVKKVLKDNGFIVES